MLKFLRNIILGLFLFITVPSILTGCEDTSAKEPQGTIDPSEMVLITKPGTYKGGTTVTLFMTPCTNEKVLKVFGPDFSKETFAAKGYYQGKEYAGCYLVDFDEGIVYFMDEEGQGGRISLESFQVAPKI